MPDVQISEKLLPFLEKNKRFKVAFGGRGSGKSTGFADIDIMDVLSKGIKTACFREFQSSIDDSVHSLLKRRIKRLGVERQFKITDNKIEVVGRNGYEDAFKFRGLARNSSGVKSMDGFKRFWVEEAQFLSEQSLEDLTPTARSDFDESELGIDETTEIWFSGNLKSLADPFSQRFFVPFEKELRATGYYEDDLHLIIWINYTDNPFFPKDLGQERAYDEENKTTAKYRHIWLGEPYDEVDNTLIPVEWFEAAIDSHIRLNAPQMKTGAIVASHDPSDMGEDPKGYALREGVVFTDVQDQDIGDAGDGCDWALDKAIAAGADWFVWDSGGMGVTLKRQVDAALKGKQMDWAMFNGAEAVERPEADFDPVNESGAKKKKKNKEALANRRAQAYVDMARAFNRTWRAVVKGEYVDPLELISVSSDIESLDNIRAEVCRIPLKPNNSEKIQIMSKDEMEKKYKIPSPNMADCMAMAYGFVPQEKAKAVTFNFASWGS